MSTILEAGVDGLPYHPNIDDVQEPGAAPGRPNHNLPFPALLSLDNEVASGVHGHHHYRGHRERELEALCSLRNDNKHLHGAENPSAIFGHRSQDHAYPPHNPGAVLDTSSSYKEKRRHRHWPHHDHRGPHRHHVHSAKEYAGGSLVVSGNSDHIHSHSHKRGHNRRHGRQRGHHGYLVHPQRRGTKIHAEDPVIGLGNDKHIHTHSHKRGCHCHGKHSLHGYHRQHGHSYRKHRGYSTNMHTGDLVTTSGSHTHAHAHSQRAHSKHAVATRQTLCEKFNGLYGAELDVINCAQPHPSLAPLLLGSVWQGLRLGVENYPARADLRGQGLRGYQSQGGLLEITAFKRLSQKRGIMDPLLPPVAPISGVVGVIDIVNTVAHTAPPERLASLIMSPWRNTTNMQSADRGDSPSYTINASNSTSTTIYLVPQDTQADLAPSEKVVLIAMPVPQTNDGSFKASIYHDTIRYDPNSASPSQLSSQPCAYNVHAGLDINSTSTHFSQLFSWNIEAGTINPLWLNQAGPALVDTTNAPGGASDPADVGGYIIGGTPLLDAEPSSSKRIGMIFRASPVGSSPRAGNSTKSMPSSPPTLESLSNTRGERGTYPDEEASTSDPDGSSQAYQDSGDGAYEDDADSYESFPDEDDTNNDSENAIEEALTTTQSAVLATSTALDQGVAASTRTAQAKAVTSTSTILFAPTLLTDASGSVSSAADSGSIATPNPVL